MRATTFVLVRRDVHMGKLVTQSCKWAEYCDTKTIPVQFTKATLSLFLLILERSHDIKGAAVDNIYQYSKNTCEASPLRQDVLTACGKKVRTTTTDKGGHASTSANNNKTKSNDAGETSPTKRKRWKLTGASFILLNASLVRPALELRACTLLLQKSFSGNNRRLPATISLFV